MASSKLIEVEPIDRTLRGITPETFAFWKYGKGTYKGEPVHIASHFSNGRMVGQKIRTRSKDFKVLGKLEPLYGQWLWSPTRRLVVTEGELDALSVSQVMNNRWPVVSIPQGAPSAAKALGEASEWVEEFDEVVLLFDQDEVGRDAAEEAAQVLSPGKAKIGVLPRKDANEMLKAEEEKALMQAIYDAKTYRPDGIVSLGDVMHEILTPPKVGMSAPWQTMTDLMYGFRPGEWYCIGAGVGVGKTDVFMTILAHLLKQNEPVAGIFLEQPVSETGKRLAGKLDGKLYHVPDVEFDPKGLEETLASISDHLYLYNHFGTCDWDVIKKLLRYLRHGCGVRYVFLDHLTALASHADDERRALDSICAEMSSLCQELGLTMFVVSHLTTPSGEAHEEGGRVKEKHFTGSRAIARWAHYMIGLERNKQDEDEEERHVTTVRFLKDRYTGRATGKCFRIKYDPESGVLAEVPPAADNLDVFDEKDF